MVLDLGGQEAFKEGDRVPQKGFEVLLRLIVIMQA